MMDIIQRICEPNKFDVQPQYTVCKVDKDNGIHVYYIQLGTLEEINWQPISAILDTLCKPLYEDHHFIEELIALLNDDKRSLSVLSSIIVKYNRN